MLYDEHFVFNFIFHFYFICFTMSILLWDSTIFTHKALRTFEVYLTIFEYDHSLGIIRHCAYNRPFSQTSNIMFPNSVCRMYIHIRHTIVPIKEFTDDCFWVSMIFTHKALRTYEVHLTSFEYDPSLCIIRHCAYNRPFSRMSNIVFPNFVCPMYIHIYHTIVHIKEFSDDLSEVCQCFHTLLFNPTG